MPSALAVLRLIISSYFAGAWTGEVARFLALEDAVDYEAATSKIIEQVISVGQQTTEVSEETVWIDGREMVASSQRGDLPAMGDRKESGITIKTTIRLACLCGKDGFELGHVVNRRNDRLHGEGRSSSLKGFRKYEIWRRCRVEQESDPVDVRRNLLEQLQPLAGHRGLEKDETSDIAARPRKARDKATADRIGNGRENDGNSARLLQQRRSGGCGLRKNEVGLQRDEFLRGSLHRLQSGVAQRVSIRMLRPSTHPSLEPLPESNEWPVLPGRSRHSPSARRSAASARPVRARRKRPGESRAADKRDEIAPPHTNCLPG